MSTDGRETKQKPVEVGWPHQGRPLTPLSGQGHVERCPFCSEAFDRRDLGQVLAHYDHQLAAGAAPAIEIGPDEDLMRW